MPYTAKKQCNDMASCYLSIDLLIPCLASFSDAVSGVKNLTIFVPAIICLISANKHFYAAMSGTRRLLYIHAGIICMTCSLLVFVLHF